MLKAGLPTMLIVLISFSGSSPVYAANGNFWKGFLDGFNRSSEQKQQERENERQRQHELQMRRNQNDLKNSNDPQPITRDYAKRKAINLYKLLNSNIFVETINCDQSDGNVYLEIIPNNVFNKGFLTFFDEISIRCKIDSIYRE